MKGLAEIEELKDQRELLTRLMELATVTDDSVGLKDLFMEKERELKKTAVCKVHKYVIRQIKINKNGDGALQEYWQTYAPWRKSGNIRKAREADLYEELYQHYFGTEPVKNKTPSVNEMFYRWVED